MKLASLRVQLAATFLAVALLPTLVVGAVALALAVRQVEADVAARNGQVAEAVAGEVGRFLEAQLVHLHEVARAAERSTERFTEQATAHQQSNPAMRTLVALDRRGRVTAAVPPDPDLVGIDLSGQGAVREALSTGAPTWSQAVTSIQTGQPVVTLVVPGAGVAVMGYLELSTLREISRRSQAGHRGEAAILDRDGTFIAEPGERLAREQVNVRDLPLVLAGLAGGLATGEYALEGRRFLGSVARVPLTSWLVLVSEPTESAFAPVTRLRATLLAALAAAVAVALLAGALSQRRLLRPLRALGEATRRIAAGERPAAAARRYVFAEYQDLARRFDDMASAVRAREAELARSEQQLRRIIESPLVGIGRTRAADGEILFCNEALARMLGWDGPADLVGRSMPTLYLDPAQRHRTVASLGADGRVANQEVEMRTRSGRPLTVLLNLFRDGDDLVGMVVDVTALRQAARDRERLEQQLQHSQRLEAVGRLAGGVAHDFNNLLTAIIGDGTLLEEELGRDHPSRPLARGILEAAGRAAHLTKSLLAFSRKQPLRPRPVDLAVVVRGVERLVRRVVGEDVDLRVEVPAAPLPVVADPSQLEQVLVNLCTNARDAMPRGGRITLTAGPAGLDEAGAAARGLSGPGPWIRLSVADTGEGIKAEDLPRVFEPFFTTKGVGRGTGLGLSIVDGIVRQHGGHVGVESRVGAGTTFTILLPASGEAAVAGDGDAARAPGPGGTETILLAEDEPAVRRVLQITLERAGYRVLAVEDGAQAVARFRVRPAEIDLCLLDVIMPGMNGREAYDAIGLIDPTARVLFVSGYTADLLEQRGVAEGLPEVVAKPVSPPELLARVRAALDRPRGRRAGTA